MAVDTVPPWSPVGRDRQQSFELIERLIIYQRTRRRRNCSAVAEAIACPRHDRQHRAEQRCTTQRAKQAIDWWKVRHSGCAPRAEAGVPISFFSTGLNNGQVTCSALAAGFLEKPADWCKDPSEDFGSSVRSGVRAAGGAHALRVSGRHKAGCTWRNAIEAPIRHRRPGKLDVGNHLTFK